MKTIHPLRLSLAWLVLLVPDGGVVAQPITQPTNQGAAKAEDRVDSDGLTVAEREQLARDRFVISHVATKQIFSTYVSSPNAFVTTDSVLNAYHVLFEESIRHLEARSGQRLAAILKPTWERLTTIDKLVDGDPRRAAEARQLAQIIIGTSLTLLRDAPLDPKADDTTSGLIAEEVKRVVSASAGLFKPNWLGPPDADFVALDYGRYQPLGFYDTTEPLRRYFRATAWLQSIPLRCDVDGELISAVMIAHAMFGGELGSDIAIEEFYARYHHLLGENDDPDITDARYTFDDARHLPADLAKIRQTLSDAPGSRYGRISDQVRVRPGSGPTAFRVLPSHVTPDGVLFHRITERTRDLPVGLHVAALLGSDSALAKVVRLDPAAPGDIDPIKPWLEQDTLYARHLRTLSALFEPPEADVPAQFGSPQWKVKSCQTALAGWAQARHTWTLQAKTAMVVLGIREVEPGGFVEPAPEFYSRLADLAFATLAELKGVMEGRDLTSAAAGMRRLEQIAREAGSADKFLARTRQSADEDGTIASAFSVLHALFGPVRSEADFRALIDRSLPKLAEYAMDLQNGVGIARDPRVLEALKPRKPLGDRWQSLVHLCRRLEALAQKQLRGVNFSEEERDFLTHYGQELAPIMLHDEMAYDVPRDDATRIADVCVRPKPDGSEEILEVGIDRPRLIYVLYPWHGKDVLCKGAVLPYMETIRSSRLTDSQWKDLLDSPDRPALPTWVQTIYSPAGRGRPVLSKPE